MKTPLEKQKEIDEANVRCARLILADETMPVECLGKMWARMVLDRAEEKCSGK